ncbi:hypothetical protein TspCOW1_13870 [Thiohalobacter sp. COW1]|uniref:hypothetical protein n=1 Tax=Thiohalobacter sp. COW1 TaxID=2795687 RepID=UPI0019151594|nr:hypothetical protein [Thiohalobacter sp. COW1]BCO31284.1 hypothetical protein TspCOW1_13870 [Thiohalobacter sp. COW1]
MKAFAMSGIIGLTMLAPAPMVFAADAPVSAGVNCAGEADCRVKWQRAEQWVRSHSEWPIKTATETLIETQRQRFRNYSRLYYRITREKQEGNTEIRFDAGCLPSVHCNPDPEAARAEFNRFVRGGG